MEEEEEEYDDVDIPKPVFFNSKLDEKKEKENKEEKNELNKKEENNDNINNNKNENKEIEDNIYNSCRSKEVQRSFGISDSTKYRTSEVIYHHCRKSYKIYLKIL